MTSCDTSALTEEFEDNGDKYGHHHVTVAWKEKICYKPTADHCGIENSTTLAQGEINTKDQLIALAVSGAPMLSHGKSIFTRVRQRHQMLTVTGTSRGNNSASENSDADTNTSFSTNSNEHCLFTIEIPLSSRNSVHYTVSGISFDNDQNFSVEIAEKAFDGDLKENIIQQDYILTQDKKSSLDSNIHLSKADCTPFRPSRKESFAFAASYKSGQRLTGTVDIDYNCNTITDHCDCHCHCHRHPESQTGEFNDMMPSRPLRKASLLKDRIIVSTRHTETGDLDLLPNMPSRKASRIDHTSIDGVHSSIESCHDKKQLANLDTTASKQVDIFPASFNTTTDGEVDEIPYQPVRKPSETHIFDTKGTNKASPHENANNMLDKFQQDSSLMLYPLRMIMPQSSMLTISILDSEDTSRLMSLSSSRFILQRKMPCKACDTTKRCVSITQSAVFTDVDSQEHYKASADIELLSPSEQPLQRRTLSRSLSQLSTEPNTSPSLPHPSVPSCEHALTAELVGPQSQAQPHVFDWMPSIPSRMASSTSSRHTTDILLAAVSAAIANASASSQFSLE